LLRHFNYETQLLLIFLDVDVTLIMKQTIIFILIF